MKSWPIPDGGSRRPPAGRRGRDHRRRRIIPGRGGGFRPHPGRRSGSGVFQSRTWPASFPSRRDGPGNPVPIPSGPRSSPAAAPVVFRPDDAAGIIAVAGSFPGVVVSIHHRTMGQRRGPVLLAWRSSGGGLRLPQAEGVVLVSSATTSDASRPDGAAGIVADAGSSRNVATTVHSLDGVTASSFIPSTTRSCSACSTGRSLCAITTTLCLLSFCLSLRRAWIL